MRGSCSTPRARLGSLNTRLAATVLIPTASVAALAGASSVTRAQPGQAAPRTAEPGLPAATPCTRQRTRLRCPDLIMSAPSALHLDRTTRPGRILLRATSSINNRGSGPLELRAHRTGRHSWAIYQALYGRRRHRHLFRTGGELVYKHVPGNRYEYGYVGSSSYWKLKRAAAFELWSIDEHYKALRLVRAGPKVAYCLRDLTRKHPSGRSPGAPVYPACNENPNIRRDVLGTSVGWSDVYPYEYPEQWINVTGLRGRFAYVQIADPGNLLMESSHRNNVSETYLALPSGRVLGHRVGVSAP